jgi:hypothetical protein
MLLDAGEGLLGIVCLMIGRCWYLLEDPLTWRVRAAFDGGARVEEEFIGLRRGSN